MTPLPLETRARIGKLVALLSSPVPGEVVAAANAIGRTLQNVGASWHDLVQVITAESPQTSLPPPRALDTDELFAALRVFPLKPRERGFVVSLWDFYNSRGYLTPKQFNALQGVHQRWAEAA